MAQVGRRERQRSALLDRRQCRLPARHLGENRDLEIGRRGDEEPPPLFTYVIEPLARGPLEPRVDSSATPR